MSQQVGGNCVSVASPDPTWARVAKVAAPQLPPSRSHANFSVATPNPEPRGERYPGKCSSSFARLMEYKAPTLTARLWPGPCSSLSFSCFFFFKYLFIYLAALGLSCSTRDL